MQERKPVGLTSSSSFQIGMRRTFHITNEQAQNLITSSHGVKIWLGDISSRELYKGQRYVTDIGVSGEIRVVNPFVNIRLTWKKSSWTNPSILQIRTIPNGEGKTTISFHQEKLQDSRVREEMKSYWEEILNSLKPLAQTVQILSELYTT